MTREIAYRGPRPVKLASPRGTSVGIPVQGVTSVWKYKNRTSAIVLVVTLWAGFLEAAEFHKGQNASLRLKDGTNVTGKIFDITDTFYILQFKNGDMKTVFLSDLQGNAPDPQENATKESVGDNGFREGYSTRPLPQEIAKEIRETTLQDNLISSEEEKAFRAKYAGLKIC